MKKNFIKRSILVIIGVLCLSGGGIWLVKQQQIKTQHENQKRAEQAKINQVKQTTQSLMQTKDISKKISGLKKLIQQEPKQRTQSVKQAYQFAIKKLKKQFKLENKTTLASLTIKDLASATQEQLQANSENLKNFLTQLTQQKLVYSNKQYNTLISKINTLLDKYNAQIKVLEEEKLKQQANQATQNKQTNLNSTVLNDANSNQNQKQTIQQATADNNNEMVLLNVPYINQYQVGEMACEASSLLEALHFKGYATNYNLASFIQTMPISASGNPNEGFGGSYQTVVANVFQSIYPAPLATWGQRFGNVRNISGASLEDLKQQLRAGNPVVVYVTMHFAAPQYHQYFWGTGIDNSHVMTLDGFKNGYYHVVDPAAGSYWVLANSFAYSYNLTRYAVVVA